MNSTKNAQEILDNFDDFFLTLTKDNVIKLALELEVSDSPGLTIEVNSKEIFNQILNPGKISVNVEFVPTPQVQLDISMFGKTQKDTVIVNNEIVKDKYIILNELKINNFDLLRDYHLFYGKFIYIDQQHNVTDVKAGFWGNDTLRLLFSSPFTEWHTANSTKNTQISQSLHYRDSRLTVEAFDNLFKNVKLLE